MISMFTLTLLALVPTLVYVFLVWNYDFWRKRGVQGPKPRVLLGTFPSLFTQKQHFANDMDDIYRGYKETENFVGVFLLRTPQLLILDPKLAHEIYATSFKHFQDNEVAKLVDKRKDPLIANNPFVLEGQDWKVQRALISPGMTGARIKVAYSIMQKVCHSLCDYIEEQNKIVGNQGLNGKDLALRFASENVCDSVLGIKARSFTTQPIPVADHMKQFSENNTIFLIYSMMVGIFPKVINFYKAKFVRQNIENFFVKLLKQAFTMRAANKVDRQDFMNHLLALSEKNHLTDLELASHSMTFLIDGLDTTATVISHCLLLLAREPQVQEKLRREILQNIDDDNELSFEKLNELPYLDACVHESIRIFPPGLWSSKRCTEPYMLTQKNGQKVLINVNETVLIPMYSFHHDDVYYEEPEKFKPERFMPENGGLKKYRDMGVFLGFGDGPRLCLGMRFALVQTKSAISTILRNFDVKINPKTEKVNKLDPKAFLSIQKGGVWLDFQKIT